MFIWMAEAMNTQASNKLLKLIEEPSPKTLIILLAESQDNILQTIISRTQTTRIPSLFWDDVTRYLGSKKQFGSELIDSIAGRSDGDVVAAIELTKEGEKDENHASFIQLMRVCYKKNVLDMISWAEDISFTNKEAQKKFLQYSLHMFRQSILKNYTGDAIARVSSEEDAFLSNFAQFITGNNILGMSNAFSDAHYHIDRNANSIILFTNLCFKVMRFIHEA